MPNPSEFAQVIPPPNVTGSLHLGHAITCAIEDALTRWNRMCGKVTLWVPGTDHAGIATQSVVERKIYKEEGKTRHDFGREAFLEKVWAWKEVYGKGICNQIKRLGASVDWTREAFTMDENLTRAVKHAFVRFYKQGLIFRENKLVNWSSHLRTALSDLEVDHEDITGRTLKSLPGTDLKVEVGVLVHFKYKVKGEEEFLEVATTRLETMLGDVAVAVHPEDERYKQFLGKELEHPFFSDRKMTVIAASYVDKDFGTGCVKITPAHDPNDFEMGKRHGLEKITCFAEDGTISLGEEWKGKHRFLARREIEEALKKKDLFVKKEPHPMRLGFCSRSGDIVEPLLKPQWWMNCKDLAAQSVAAVREKELKIIPQREESVWFHFLENIRDWCISRQLWWGHQIPAYRVVKPVLGQEKWFVAVSHEEALAEAAAELNLSKEEIELVQDEDVLDTWFSSGLFPFSVMGWPNETPDMDAFFPGQLLETGRDILFFWVARMVMMSLGLTGKLPFTTVYLHAMVRDKNGEKMAKSKGNVLDPLEIIDGATLEALHKKVREGNLPDKEVAKAIKDQKETFPDGIPRCGADALRYGLLAYTSQGNSVNMDVSRVVGYRHFCNKLWNATRFALSHFEKAPASWDKEKEVGVWDPRLPLRLEDAYILSKLSQACSKINQAYENYDLAGCVQISYDFWLYELCDRYLELVKPRLHDETNTDSDKKTALNVLYICLDSGLRMLHPMIPFITEELYQRLPNSPKKVESICIAPYHSRY